MTDSQNVLRRVDGRTQTKEWLDSIDNSSLKKTTWICTSSHTGVSGNGQANGVASSGAPGNTTIGMDKEIKKAVINALITRR